MSQSVDWVTTGGGNKKILFFDIGNVIWSIKKYENYIYVTGFTFGNIAQLSGESLTPGRQLFIAKYKETGEIIWKRTLPIEIGDFFGENIPGALPYETDIAINSEHEIFVTGNDDFNSYLFKFNESGDLLESKELPFRKAFELAIDKNNDIVIAGFGRFNDSVVEDTVLNLSEIRHGFLIKYNQSIDFQWVSVPTGMPSYFKTLNIDNNNNIFVSGHFVNYEEENDTLRFGSKNLIVESELNEQVLISKVSENGQVQWLKQIGSEDDDTVNKIRTDKLGNVFLTGGFSGVIQVEEETFAGKGGEDIYLAKFGSDSGELRWIETAGSIAPGYFYGRDEGRSLTIDDEGNIILVGSCNYEATFGGGNRQIKIHTKAEDKINDAGFIAVYDPDGNLISAYNIENEDRSLIEDIFEEKGNIYISGFFINDANLFGTTFPKPFENNINLFLAEISLSEITSTLRDKFADFLIYPNPADDILYIDHNNIFTDNTLSVIDTNGRILFDNALTKGNSIDLSSLKPGIYILRLYHDKQIISRRITVK